MPTKDKIVASVCHRHLRSIYLQYPYEYHCIQTAGVEAIQVLQRLLSFYENQINQQMEHIIQYICYSALQYTSTTSQPLQPEVSQQILNQVMQYLCDIIALVYDWKQLILSTHPNRTSILQEEEFTRQQQRVLIASAKCCVQLLNTLPCLQLTRESEKHIIYLLRNEFKKQPQI
jgi:hypothetical protein